ncbi:unnamed protein product [Orchesella dallaii]|uniref:Uncharacterized protein n=1 Tax=Orchesella dallaii TaxID=48710 RepID=A0ABP1QX04_9HEXA
MNRGRKHPDKDKQLPVTNNQAECVVFVALISTNLIFDMTYLLPLYTNDELSLYIHHILLLFVSTAVVYVHSGNNRHQIDLFSNRDFSGIRTTLSLTHCSNVLTPAINTTSSIKTNGRCAQLYDQLYCTGNTIQIPARGSSSHDLAEWGFNDKVQSVGLCRDTPEVNQSIPFYNGTVTRNKSNNSIIITLHETPNRNG